MEQHRASAMLCAVFCAIQAKNFFDISTLEGLTSKNVCAIVFYS